MLFANNSIKLINFSAACIPSSYVSTLMQVIEGTTVHFDCDTLVLSVGLIPENELSKSLGLEIDRKTMGPCLDENLQTGIPGIFACGNVAHVHDIVDNVTKEAIKAGEDLENGENGNHRGRPFYEKEFIPKSTRYNTTNGAEMQEKNL